MLFRIILSVINRISCLIICVAPITIPLVFLELVQLVLLVLAQLVLLDILFQEYFRRNQNECEESLQRIAAALSEKHI